MWTIFLSYTFVIGMVIYIIWLATKLFIQIENVNVYKMKSDKGLLDRAEIPKDLDLFPFGIATKLKCE